MDIKSDRLVDIPQLTSPNTSPRPPGVLPELLVIHGISLPPGEYGGQGINQLFTNRLDPEADPYYRQITATRVSAHLVIYRDGNISQFVPFNQCAWHAGESVYQGRTQCNDFSIGIEMEGCDEEPYTRIQYQQLVQIVATLLDAYPSLSAQRIVGHCDIAPGRKTDPGPFFEYDFLEKYR